jgi:hypothetical protein
MERASPTGARATFLAASIMCSCASQNAGSSVRSGASVTRVSGPISPSSSSAWVARATISLLRTAIARQTLPAIE